MTDAELHALYARINAMSESELMDLEQICEALRKYQTKYPPIRRGRVLPNLVAALAAVDAMKAWEQAEWGCE